MDISSYITTYIYNTESKRKNINLMCQQKKIYPYAKRNLLTKTEYAFYFVLAETFPGYIMPKGKT